MTHAKLPEYDSPPAVETLMGVHFARFTGWNILHFGQLYAQFRVMYPKATFLPPLIEQQDLAQGTFNPQDSLIRAIFTNETDTELLQVQSSMFLRNWKRTEHTQEYTHYASLKPKFQDDWNKFKAFLEENGLKVPQVIQCEVAYVNHLLRGREWNSYSDLAQFIKPFAPRSPVSSFGRVYKYLPEAASVSLNVGYYFSEASVSLQISVQSAIRQPDGSEVIQMVVTAKATPRSNSDQSILEMLDRCHEAVILGFDDVITENAQKRWGRR